MLSLSFVIYTSTERAWTKELKNLKEIESVSCLFICVFYLFIHLQREIMRFFTVFKKYVNFLTFSRDSKCIIFHLFDISSFNCTIACKSLGKLN